MTMKDDENDSGNTPLTQIVGRREEEASSQSSSSISGSSGDNCNSRFTQSSRTVMACWLEDGDLDDEDDVNFLVDQAIVPHLCENYPTALIQIGSSDEEDHVDDEAFLVSILGRALDVCYAIEFDDDDDYSLCASQSVEDDFTVETDSRVAQ